MTDEPKDEAMGGDEFRSLVRAVADPLERMKHGGGGFPPDIIETFAAMESLANRWYRCNVKEQLAALSEKDAEIERLRAKLANVEIRVESGDGGSVI